MRQAKTNDSIYSSLCSGDQKPSLWTWFASILPPVLFSLGVVAILQKMRSKLDDSHKNILKYEDEIRRKSLQLNMAENSSEKEENIENLATNKKED